MTELLVLLTVIALPIGITAVRAWRSRTLTPLVEAGRGLVAGAAAGVLWGVGARVAMRAIALAAGDPTQFTIGGTPIAGARKRASACRCRSRATPPATLLPTRRSSACFRNA